MLLLANIHVRESAKKTNISKVLMKFHLNLLHQTISYVKVDTLMHLSQLGDEAVNIMMKKMFKNYTSWCKFLGRKSNIR